MSSDEYTARIVKNPRATTRLRLEPESWDALAPLLPQMSKLEELALDLRAARPWPAAVFKLPRLRHVELPVKVLDEQLRKLPHLESLQIEGVQGKPHTAPLPAWLWKLRLKRLDLLYFALRAFPDGLLGMTTLEELQFQRAGHGDQRLRVPAEIARLTRLRKLGLCCVDATGVPFDAFRELRKLELSHAKIDRLPDGFGKLRKLTDLKIEESAIDALPDSLGGCRALEHLVLMKLPLTALPASVGDLRALRSVWIDGTPIDALPESLGRCKQLESAWVTETRITEAPAAVVRLPKLEDLRLGGNYFSPDGYKALESALKKRRPKIVDPGMPRRGRAESAKARHPGAAVNDRAPGELRYEKGTSRKFWRASVDGAAMTVTYGRIGTAGQTQTKRFRSPELAQRERAKLIAEKVRKGYRDVAGAKAPAATQAARPTQGAGDLSPKVQAEIRRLGLAFKDDLPVEESVAGVRYALAPALQKLLGIKRGPDFVIDVYEEGEDKKASFPDYGGALDEFECIHHHPYVSVGSFEHFQQVLVRLDDPKPQDPHVYTIDLDGDWDRTELGSGTRLSEWLKALRPAPKTTKA